MTCTGRAATSIAIALVSVLQVIGQSGPIANAGPDRTASIGESVTLDGSLSADPSGGLLTYRWSFLIRPEGSGATLSNSTAAVTTFVIDVAGTYVLSLVVAIGLQESAPDFVTVSATNHAPVADAGPDVAVRVGERAVLDGTQSFDLDFDRLTYQWFVLIKPDCSRAILTGATSANSTFLLDCPGTYLVHLLVSDGIASSSDVVLVTTENSAPVADAGPDRTVEIGRAVRLDGSLSLDLDANSITYTWSFASRPPGSTATLDDPHAVFPTFVPDLPGAYRVRLVVNDGLANSIADTVVVSTINSAPVANAGRDQHASIGELVRLDGSLSTDADGQALRFSWSLVGRPSASGAALDDPTLIRPAFVADPPGTYILQLIVHDGLVSSAADTVRVTTGNVAPVADAGLDQTVQTGSAVRVSGVGSNDADGNELGFRWALIAQPAGSTSILFNVQAVRPAFVPDRPGVYVLQLVVTDGMNISDPDTVVITTGNTAPTADAGPDQTIATGLSAILDGTRSTDVNGDPLTFRWTLVAHPINSNARLVRDTPVTVLTVDVPGIYVASLEVGDGTLTSRPDTVVISSQNSIPVAKAGTNQEVRTGSAVTLDGTGSTDADFAPLIYRWSLLVRPWSSRALLSDAASPTPVFTADAAGTYIAQLVVNDGFAWSPPSTVLIAAVNRINHPPVANAGPDQHVVPGTPVQLDGRGSRDPDPDTLTFRWTLTPPPGSSAIVDDPTSPTPTFVTDLRGRYDAQLVVSDGEFTSIDFVTVIANQQPTSSVVVQSSVTVGDTVQLDGQGSSDADGDPLTYVWTLTVPPSSKATLIDPQSALATFVPDVPGDYIARLIVNDGLEASVPATNQIVASPRPSDSILCGETKSGTIASAAERNEFTFTGAQGEAVVFAAVAIAAPLAPVAELYDPNNVLRFRTLPNRQSLSVQLPVSGTYKIIVHDDNLSDIGNYNLNLQSSSGGCGDAIACGTTLPGVVPGGSNQTGNPHAQQDSFTFIGGQNDAVVFAAVATSGLIAPVAELYDPNGVLRFRTLPNRQSLSVSLTVTGTYTIIVHDDNLVDGGSYNVNMHSSSGKCGTPIQCGETLAGALPGAKNPTALPHAQQDGYTFIATQGESVVFAAVATGGTVLPVAELYDPNGVLRFRTLPNRQSLSVSLPVTGTYTVIVHDDNLVDGGTYNINMHSSSGKCGAAIQCGQTLAGVLPGAKNSTTLPHAQQDGYTFTATQGEAVVFAAVATGGTVAPVAELYDPNGVLRFRTLPNRQSLSVSLPVTGTYTVVVHDDNLVDGGTYNVNVHSSSGKCGAAIQCGDTLAGALPDAKNPTTLPHAQQDGYTFIGTQGEAVVFAAVATGGTVAPVAELYDPNGVLRFRTLPNRQSLSVSLPATGPYTIIVRDDDLVDGGAYNVNLEFSTGRCAAELVCGIPVIGTISGAAEQDAYAFTGSAGESVIIEVIAIDATSVAPIAELYAPNGVLLFRTLANRASLAISLPATSRYTILVHDDDLRDSGSYRIRYERVGGCPAPAVTVDPALIDFGEHEVGTGSTPRTVTVTNSGTAPLSITSVIPSGDFDIVGDLCSPNSLLPSGSCTFNVRFTPTVEGPRSGEVSITSNAASSPHRVMLSGTGVRRTLTLTPNPLEFGSVQVGTPSPTGFVTVHNAGVGPVQVTSFAAAGDFVVVAVQSNCSLTSPLQAGANCFIALQATATVAGPRTGTLTLASTATNTPHLVDLLANGVRETVTVGTLIESLEVGGNGMRINPTKTGSLTISRLALLAEWTLTKSDEAGSLERSPSMTSSAHLQTDQV